MNLSALVDAGLDRIGLVRKVVIEPVHDTEVAATVEVVGEINMKKQGYRTTMVAANWPALQEAASGIRAEHGRWPTHYALPRQGVSQELVDFLQGSILREMSGMTGQGSTIFLGFDATEHEVRRMPSWMKAEVVEVEQEPEPEVAPEPETPEVEVAEAPVEVEESQPPSLREFMLDLIESGKPVEVTTSEEAKVLAAIVREGRS